MNHSQLQELLRSRVDGVRLSQEVVRAGAELDLIRANHFPPWPATLLRPRRASAEPGDTMTFQFRRGSARPAEPPGPARGRPRERGRGVAVRDVAELVPHSSPVLLATSDASLRPDSKGAGSEVTARRKSSTHLSEAPPSSGASRPSSQMSPEAAKLFERVQELQRLRSQWWSRRQGPGAVVRRALASEGLVLDPNSSTYFQADKPPAELCEGGFFAQVHSSMTAL
ncbi:unnamed protein product [Prorocentrum cordatum]|uniref:Uncharacterized protein n=1 Tax=Prorocentrum cordatum TaxID=2364126 RepID=A0ABN9SQF7_9DINO|nr:unnamed protein product [Polarella glacialis]